MTKSKTSATSAMEVGSASTTSSTTSVTSTAASNGPTSTPSAVATPVSTTSESKVVASTKSSTMTPTPATISDSKVTSYATKESSTSAKDKKPAPPTSVNTDAALGNSSSTAPISATPSTAKMLAKDTTVKGAVPDIEDTASSVTDKKSASSREVSAEVIQNYVKPKVVEKVFDLPVVSDTYDSLVKLSSPLSPYVEKIGTLASPMVDQALDLRARIEDKVPEGVQTGYTTTLNKVVTAAVSLDATLCSGVDTLVEKVPVLKQATPILFNSTRESVSSYATLVATYMASFTIAQVFLKAADLGLETTDGLLKLTANEKVDPILRGLRKVRSEASSLRKEGIVLNGTVKAKTLEEATLIGAMMEIFGLGSFFNQPGNSRDEDEGLPEDEDAIDVVAMLPSKTRSGLVL